jgi:hypothetical protein
VPRHLSQALQQPQAARESLIGQAGDVLPAHRPQDTVVNEQVEQVPQRLGDRDEFAVAANETGELFQEPIGQLAQSGERRVDQDLGCLLGAVLVSP